MPPYPTKTKPIVQSMWKLFHETIEKFHLRFLLSQTPISTKKISIMQNRFAHTFPRHKTYLMQLPAATPEQNIPFNLLCQPSRRRRLFSLAATTALSCLFNLPPPTLTVREARRCNTFPPRTSNTFVNFFASSPAVQIWAKPADARKWCGKNTPKSFYVKSTLRKVLFPSIFHCTRARKN